MNTTTKTIFLSVAMFAIVGMMGFTTSALAVPQPEPGNTKVYQFNMIARPNNYEGGCGDGDRIFIDANDSSSQVRIYEGDEWNVTDCNATSDRRADLEVDGTGTFIVYAIAHGKPGTSISICADYISAYDGDGNLCEIGTFSISREGGKSQFKVVPSELFDASLEDIIWDVDATGQAKVQFRVYQTG